MYKIKIDHTLIMNITFLSFQSILFYLTMIQSSSKDDLEDVVTFEETRMIDFPLSFSFDNDTFNNFKCNFNNETLTHRLLKSPPFYINESVKNVISTFCLIFQYSLIKNNTDFKKTVEKLFELTFIENEKIVKGRHDFEYDSKYFINNLNKLDEIVKNILEGNYSEIVLVHKKNDRITITQRNSSVKINFKLFDLIIDTIDNPINDELYNAMIEFYTMLNESYLQDQLQRSYFIAVSSLQYIVACREERRSVDVKLPVHPSKNIIESYTRLYKLIEEDKSDSNEIGAGEEKIENSTDKHSLIFSKMYVNRKFPDYLNMLQSKVAAKCFYGAWKYIGNLDRCYLFPIEYEKNLYEFIRLLVCTFGDDDIIKFQNGKLEEESIENLVKNCLELIL